MFWSTYITCYTSTTPSTATTAISTDTATLLLLVINITDNSGWEFSHKYVFLSSVP